MIEFINSLVPANIAAHAPALLIVVPMILAPLAAFMPNGRLAWLLSIIATGASLVMAMVMVVQVRSIEGGAVLSYAMGGWAPDAGIEFRIDALNSMVLLLVTTIGFLAALFSWPSIKAEIRDALQAMRLTCLSSSRLARLRLMCLSHWDLAGIAGHCPQLETTSLWEQLARLSSLLGSGSSMPPPGR